ncbi:hypothetical protein [Noviherbaspirillum humi]|uniref:hypothetical protein n=1 Tax=Noviherbaspirillum humi TaxID=1688639 RepID=UPI001160CD2D|nr:hypothetical protein [Noviherbaspirillum humi]
MGSLRKTVLVAITDPDNRQALQFLEESYTLYYASNMGEAKACLKGPIDLVICGLTFNDSRMFELLGLIKALPFGQIPPAICIRMKPGRLEQNYTLLIEQAIELNGVGEFVNFSSWVHEKGRETAQARLLSKVRGYLDR